MAKKRTYPVLTDAVERLREARGLTREKLAEAAEINVKTLRRLLNGEEAYLDTINKLATVLRTTPDALRADLAVTEPEQVTTFSLDLNLSGTAADPHTALSLVTLTPKIIDLLKAHGINVTGHQAGLGMQQYGGDALSQFKRTIALVYGILANGNPFWAFVAVITHKYQQFLVDQKQGKLDLTRFEPYGEIIICGEGLCPDDGIIERVAAMYQTDNGQFALNVQEDIRAAMPVLKAALEHDKNAE